MDINKEIDEYRRLRAWLAGKKPAAQGRSWTRGAVLKIAQAVDVVEQTTREHPLAVVGGLLGSVVVLAGPALLIIGGPALLTSLMSEVLPGFESGQLPIFGMMRTVLKEVSSIIYLLGGMGLGVLGIKMMLHR